MLRSVQEDMSGAAVCIGNADPDALFYDGLQYSPPARGTWNIVHTAMLVPESHQIYICALGCLRGVVLTAAEMNVMDRFSSVVIEEKHLYDGTMEETMISSVADILQRMPQLPRVAFMYPSCVHHFMGCDMDYVYMKLQQDFPSVHIVPCWMDPIRRQSDLTAEMRTRRQIYAPLKKTENQDHGAVNIIGSNLTVQSCELTMLIQAQGMTLRQLPACKTYADYEKMSRSFLNIGQEPLAYAPLQDMEQRLGQPYLYLPAVWDYEGITAQLKQLADKLSCDLPDYSRHIGCCEEKFAEARACIGAMPIAVDYTAVFQPFGLARVLVQHGFCVRRVYADACTAEDKDNFLWLQEHCPSLMIYSARHAKMRTASRSPGEPWLAIGQKAAYFTGTTHFVNMAEGGGLRDFTGLQTLLDLMINACQHEKEAVHYIQQKGWGCISCL